MIDMFAELIADPMIDFQQVLQMDQYIQDSCNQLLNKKQKQKQYYHHYEEKVTIEDLLKLSTIRKKKSKTNAKLCSKISKSKANKKGLKAGYKKNLCGYITKKGIRQFIYGHYQKQVEELCSSEHVDFQLAKNFYDNKIQIVTGPSHLNQLFTTLKSEQIPLLRVFVKFFIWFLKERYIRHLFLQGKMEIKKAYIDYKNKLLLPMIHEYQKRLFEESLNSSTLHAEQFINSVL